MGHNTYVARAKTHISVMPVDYICSSHRLGSFGKYIQMFVLDIADVDMAGI